jgi:hypothetical protein
MVFDEQRLPGVHALGNHHYRILLREGGADNAYGMGLKHHHHRRSEI